jgi:MOSC domain-containing protein YiiM
VIAGRVVGLHKKGEVAGERGLPKSPAAVLRVRREGVEGDFNRWRQERLAGDPNMALLILPVETIEELNREGWPVKPGDLGENITTSGIPYAALAPPRRFRVGGIVVETSKACTPCENLALLPYVGSERGAAFERTMAGRRGWFARVAEAGEVRVGDAIAPLP